MKYVLATVTAKGQFTIPKAIREQIGITPGDRVTLTVAKGAIVLRPIGNRHERYVTTNLRFPVDTYAWLKMEAVRQRKSLGALIREMLHRQEGE